MRQNQSKPKVDRETAHDQSPTSNMSTVYPANDDPQDGERGSSQPFLMKFASPVLRDPRPEPPPGTMFTAVARETTDDR